QAGTPARAKGFNGSLPATIKTLTKTTTYPILSLQVACKGERVQWFLACKDNPAVAGVLACNKKTLTKTTCYPILSLQAGTPARAKGFNGSLPATIKTLTKTTTYPILSLFALNYVYVKTHNAKSLTIVKLSCGPDLLGWGSNPSQPQP
ncbi:MAG: hypothetical protein EBS07_05875, partial [Sphingobacteriia bacterium]|nr:hypothetical protein [Sphingobacteriia bacterium]